MRVTTRQTERAALYHRTLALDASPTAAWRELRATAAGLGLRVAMQVEETGSGARNDRPGLLRVMNAVRHRVVDAVLVWKLDRFGCSPLDVLTNIRELQRRGVRLLVTRQGIGIRPGGDAISGLVLTTLEAVAQFERNLISVRTRRGIERARARGAHIGRPRKLGQPTRATVVELRRRGLSWNEAARKLRCSTGMLRRIASGAR